MEGDTGKGKTEPSSCATAKDTMDMLQSKAMVTAVVFMVDIPRGCGIGFQPVMIPYPQAGSLCHMNSTYSSI